jgi:Chaperone of endosialidase
MKIFRLFIAFTLICFALSPSAQAVVPAPDGAYPNFTTAEGQNALKNLTTGQGNTALGWFSLFSATTGSLNTGVGAGALALNTGDSNTATGAVALFLNTTGSQNTATGTAALLNNTTGSSDTAVGDHALSANTDGAGHTAVGYNALATATAGASAFAANTAVGVNALFGDTTGNGNTAVGAVALFSNTTGGGNTAIGNFAGSTLTTGDNNICIGAGVTGIAGESDTIRIANNEAPVAGTTSKVFFGGIFSSTVSTAFPVLVNVHGQLGTAPSSARFKKEIQPMEKVSESILALKPVTFHYKSDNTNIPQFGLIAEEVAAVNPDLVGRDEKGDIYTVRYDAVNAMLLNEFLKEHRTVQELRSTVQRQQNDFQSKLAQQQKQIAALAAGLQKVSAQLEASKPTPQVVKNDD